MSEISIFELEAEHGELLPERETLGSIVVVGGAASVQTLTLASASVAVNAQKVVAVFSANF